MRKESLENMIRAKHTSDKRTRWKQQETRSESRQDSIKPILRSTTNDMKLW